MKFLLDTHALIWFCEGNPALSSTARAAMEDQANQCFVSHATAWEIAIKLNLGKLKLQIGFEIMFPDVLNANGFALLPQSLEHYQFLLTLAPHHGDPFDRLLIAQAMVENLTIISRDPHFSAYGVPLLW